MRKWVLVILLVGLVASTACATFSSSNEGDKIDEVVFLNFKDPTSFAYPEIAANCLSGGMAMLYTEDSKDNTVRIGWVFLPPGKGYVGVENLNFMAYSLSGKGVVEVRVYSWSTLDAYHWVWEGDWRKIIAENEEWWHSLAWAEYQVLLKDEFSVEDPVQDVSLSLEPDLNLAAIEFVVSTDPGEGPITIAQVDLIRDTERVKEWEELRQLLGK